MDYQKDNTMETNCAYICGEIIDECRYSHKTFGESFYVLKVAIKRNSGYEDEIRLMASERLIKNLNLELYNRVNVIGQVRTYNEEVDGKNHLNVVVFVKEIDQEDIEREKNDIYLEGYLCKNPIQRTSPLGRKICDMMLAVNRMYNKSDYIPCITWGRNAIYNSGLNIGDKVSVKGRLQSREYRKKINENIIETKIAYEVSVLHLETI